MTDTIGRYANLARIGDDICRARVWRNEPDEPVMLAVHPEWLAVLGVEPVVAVAAAHNATLIEAPPDDPYVTSITWPDAWANVSFCLGAGQPYNDR